MSAATATATMSVTVVNGNGGNDPHDVMAHRAGCRDLAGLVHDHESFTQEFGSKREVWLDYNEDFLDEGSDAWPIHFYPCTGALPDGGDYNL